MKRPKLRLPVTHDLLARDAAANADRLATTIALVEARIPDPHLARATTADMRARLDELLNEAASHRAKARVARGDPVVVVAGDRLPLGTCGVATYISDSGSILLKDPDSAHIRDSRGTWLEPAHVEKIIAT